MKPFVLHQHVVRVNVNSEKNRLSYTSILLWWMTIWYVFCVLRFAIPIHFSSVQSHRLSKLRHSSSTHYTSSVQKHWVSMSTFQPSFRSIWQPQPFQFDLPVRAYFNSIDLQSTPDCSRRLSTANHDRSFHNKPHLDAIHRRHSFRIQTQGTWTVICWNIPRLIETMELRMHSKLA